MDNQLENGIAPQVTSTLYLNEELADVHFVFKVDDDVEKVPANKVILASISPVFKSMFFGKLKEGKEVAIVDAHADAFKEFLQFFYLGKVTITIENIETIVRLADKYDILELVKAHTEPKDSSLDNICWEYQFEMALKREEKVKAFEEDFVNSPKHVFATDAFQRCEKETLKRILQLDLRCKESEVFNACLNWAKHWCKQNELDETQTKNLKLQLGDCLNLIRFGTMKCDEFAALAMKNEGIFTSGEFKDIMLSLTAPDYEPIIFSRTPRSFTWNEKFVLPCQRVSDSQPTRYVQGSEVVWFTSSDTLLLGGFNSKSTIGIENDLLLKDAEVHVTIAELSNDSPRKVLYEGSSQTWKEVENKKELMVTLKQPIFIEPQVLYEVRLTVPTTGGKSYYNTTWKPIVEMENGPTIEFVRNPRFETYDTSTNGWISCLNFNRF